MRFGGCKPRLSIIWGRDSGVRVLPPFLTLPLHAVAAPPPPPPPPPPTPTYPGVGCGQFLDPSRVCIPAYIHLFLALLDMPAAEPLRTQLAAAQDKLCMLLTASTQQQQQQQEEGGADPMTVDGTSGTGG
jgi:hypothetical protein